VRPYLEKNPSQKKRAGRVAQGVGPEFKPQYHKKKKVLRPAWATFKTLSQKTKNKTSPEHLPSMLEALDSMPRTTKKRKKMEAAQGPSWAAHAHTSAWAWSLSFYSTSLFGPH
jgi:hypothetical protein